MAQSKPYLGGLESFYNTNPQVIYNFSFNPPICT